MLNSTRINNSLTINSTFSKHNESKLPSHQFRTNSGGGKTQSSTSNENKWHVISGAHVRCPYLTFKSRSIGVDLWQWFSTCTRTPWGYAVRAQKSLDLVTKSLSWQNCYWLIPENWVTKRGAVHVCTRLSILPPLSILENRTYPNSWLPSQNIHSKWVNVFMNTKFNVILIFIHSFK
jgi:hypothetical protein